MGNTSIQVSHHRPAQIKGRGEVYNVQSLS
jgi:hypothetical protein